MGSAIGELLPLAVAIAISVTTIITTVLMLLSPEAKSRTVGLLVGLFVAVIVLVVPLGWAITGTLLFAGAATILGSKRYVLNVIIGVVLAVASFYAFYSGLGIPLPAGILDGIL